jgi:hypothetical protein
MGQVVVRAEAVWREEGMVEFYEAEPGPNSGLSSVLPGAGRARECRIVSAVTLDRILADCRQDARLIKIDVEGAELEVLKGAMRILTSARPPLVALESFEPAAIARFARSTGLSMRRLIHVSGRGFGLSQWDSEPRDALSSYEAPCYVLAREDRFAGDLAPFVLD